MAEQKKTSAHRNRRRSTVIRAAWCCAWNMPRIPDHRLSEKEQKSKVPTGEAAPTRKQGFMEKQRILSPGRVSPLMEPSGNENDKLVDSHLRDETPPIAFSPSPAGNQGNNSGAGRSTNTSTLQQMMSEEVQTRPDPVAVVSAELPESCLGSDRNGNRRDLRVTLKGTDGRVIVMDLHSHVLISQSQYFASKLAESTSFDGGFSVEVCDCPSLENYRAAIHLMYCQDFRCTLMQGTTSSAIGILEASARISFDSGVKACLEYLEAMPWTEEEEERLGKLLAEIHLDKQTVEDILERLHLQEKMGPDKLQMHVVQSVTNGTDEKARREMKFLVSKLLQESSIQEHDCSSQLKDDLYGLCHSCLDSLLKCFMQATDKNVGNELTGDKGSLITQIALQVDNINWLLEIFVARYIADDFVRIWANQFELLELYKKTSCMVRYEVSRVTAKLVMGLGKGLILCPHEVRYSLLQTWLQPLIDDFGWIQRCCKGLDMKVVEEAISQTILTLPLKQQQNILICWMECFSNSGNDCPNLQKAFEIWWRRSFLKPPQVHGTSAETS